MAEKVEKIRVSVTMTNPYLEALDRLVQGGGYVSRGEVINDALRRLFRSYEMEPFLSPLNEKGGE